MLKQARMILIVLIFISIGAQPAIAKKRPACAPTKHVSVQNRESKGEGCTKPEARRVAQANLAKDHCQGDNDPKCQGEGACSGKKECKPVARDISNLHVSYKQINKAGCANGKGWECTISASFNCGCKCQ
ncbi:MAG TPA: hypothetical protein VGK31_15055 [Thermoanaerobaculia bacterium]